VKILVLNCGSSSVKFQLFDMINEDVLAKGIVEKIGSSGAIIRYRAKDKDEIKEVREVSNHDQAIELVIGLLTHPTYGAILNKEDIVGIGHRVVHGAERFTGSVPINHDVIRGLRECIQFAPLHNPHNLKGIDAGERLLPHAFQAGVFDTAFHHQIPRPAYMYGLPYALYTKLGVRRYGFHGTSHLYVSQQAAQHMGTNLEDLKLVTCHLGNGASMAAVKGGYSVDTTMGFTPLEGLLMGTRCGDLDPALVPYIMQREHLSAAQVDDLMNKYSGLKGISETTNDMREIESEAAAGSDKHQLALDIFCLRVKKYVGAYAAEMGGLDAVVFTGGIGENSRKVRELSMEGLEFLGIEIDRERNQANAVNISRGSTPVLVIPTNEELVIARETRRLLEQAAKGGLGAISSDLSKEEKAELILLWAKYPRYAADDLAKALSRHIERPVDGATVQKELSALGLSTH